MQAGSRSRHRMLAIAALTCLAVLAAACSGGGAATDSSLIDASGTDTRGTTAASTGSTSSAPPDATSSATSRATAPSGSSDPTGGADEVAVQTYGYGAQPAPGVTYQSDVVVVPAGPAAIESATTDGLVWTLDRSATGVNELRVGSILLASSRATGRVVALVDKGNARVVTLAPVELTDIIRNGEINLSHALSADAMTYQEIPDRPGAQSVPNDGVTATTAPRLRLVAASRELSVCACGPSSGVLSPPSKGKVAIPAGDYTITPGFDANELSLDIERDGSLKVGVHFAFSVSDLTIDSGVSIKDGLVGGSRFVINGINGLTVSLSAGAAGGEADNEKIRIEVPVEVNIPIAPSPATAGLPLMIKIEFTYSIETAITGNNSTLVATGKYGLDGPIGIKGGSFLSPEFTVQQSIIDSLSGITLGPSGVVLAVKMKMQAGLGIPAASAGPFGSVTTSLGITNGSSLGASLTRCRGATLDMDVAGGVGVSISTPLLDALAKLLPPGTDIPSSTELSTNVLHRSQVVPDVPLCSGAADGSGDGGGTATG